MGLLLDRSIETNQGIVLATLPNDNSGTVILHFYSTFDDFDQEVTVEDVEVKGDWLSFEMTQNSIPNRSGRYNVEIHSSTSGSTSLDALNRAFDVINRPLDDLALFAKDLLLAETVGEIINATNTFYESQGRTITYKDYERTRTFKSQTREVDYKTNY